MHAMGNGRSDGGIRDEMCNAIRTCGACGLFAVYARARLIW